MKKIINKYVKFLITFTLAILLALGNWNLPFNSTQATQPIIGQVVQADEGYILPFEAGETLNITRIDHDTYDAIDFNTGRRTGVMARAVRSGEILNKPQIQDNTSGGNCGYGWFLRIRYDNGEIGIYAHFANQPNWNQGDRVNQGDILEEIGTTGCSTGIHLHYENRRNSSQLSSYIPRFREYPDEDLIGGGNYTAQSFNSPQEVHPSYSDAIWYNTNGEVAYWENGVWGQPSDGSGVLGNVGSNNDWLYLGKGDLNGDGALEVFWRHKSNMEVHVWDGNGDGRYLGDQSYDWQFVGVLNGSIVWRNINNWEVGTWDSFNPLQGRRLGYQSTDWQVIGIATIDNAPSIVWYNPTAREVGFWKNGNPNSGGNLGALSAPWRFVDSGDLDGDGNDELIFVHPNREVHAWYNGRQPNGRLLGTLYWNGETVLGTIRNSDGSYDILTKTNSDGKVWRWPNGIQGSDGHIATQSHDWRFLRRNSLVSIEHYYYAD